MAIWRARGGRSVTSRPPINTSPPLGASRPPIMRSKVVLPHPDGPSSTRNSPSFDARSMPSTATTPSKRFDRSRTSTMDIAIGVEQSRSRAVEECFAGGQTSACSLRYSRCVKRVLFSTARPLDCSTRLRSPAHEAFGAPFVEDGVDFLFGGGDGVLGALLAAGGASHHVRQGREGEDLAHGGVGRAGVTEVGRPVVRLFQDSQLVSRV